MNTHNLSIQERIRIWTKRKHDGQLAFPRCVRAHIREILTYDPNRLSIEEMVKYDIEYEEQEEP